MNVLLDACVWGKARSVLEQYGHDVIWVGDWEKDPGGVGILEFASAEQRVLVTLDKDFGELAVVRGMRHAGIVRLVGLSAVEQAERCEQVFRRYGDELRGGSDRDC